MNGRGSTMSNETVIVGVDVGGTHIRFGAVAEDNTLKKEAKVSSRIIEGDMAGERLLRLIEDFIASLDAAVDAVSIGIPGTLNKERGAVVSVPNLKGLDHIEIKEPYQQRLGIPVFLEKDSCMLVYNDLEKYAIPRCGIVIGIYVGTGLGNIILVDGKPLVGKDGAAWELGHIPVFGKEDPCGCGLTGCMELYAAGKGLVRICAEKFPGTPIEKIFTAHGGDAEIKTFVGNIAMAVATEVNILNPDTLILGGGVLGMENFPYEDLLLHIKNLARKPVPADTLCIIRADCDQPFSGVTGAAIFARTMLNEHTIPIRSGE